MKESLEPLLTFRRASSRRKSPRPSARRSTSAQLWGTPPRELGPPGPPRLRYVAAKTSRSRTRLREPPCSAVFRHPAVRWMISWPERKRWSVELSRLSRPRLTCSVTSSRTQLYRTTVNGPEAGEQLPVNAFKIRSENVNVWAGGAVKQSFLSADEGENFSIVPFNCFPSHVKFQPFTLHRFRRWDIVLPLSFGPCASLTTNSWLPPRDGDWN